MVASTVDRVSQQTSHELTRRIESWIAESVGWHASHPERIDHRLHELDEEWDIERTLEANASTLALTGVALAATVDKRWFILPALVTAFLFQHDMQGWCPPLPVLRRLGFRTARDRNRALCPQGAARRFWPDRARPGQSRHPRKPYPSGGQTVTGEHHAMSDQQEGSFPVSAGKLPGLIASCHNQGLAPKAWRRTRG